MATSEATRTYAPDAVKATAGKLLAQYRTLFTATQGYAPVDRSAYDTAVFDWYDAKGAELATLGFAHLGDMTPIPANPKPGAPPGAFLRRFLAADGAVCADIFQMKGGTHGTWTRVANMVSALGDGRFLVTSTAPRRFNTPDHVLVDYAAPDTPVADLSRAHRERMQRHLQAHAGATVDRWRSLDEVLAADSRMLAATAAFRQRQGTPDVEELVRLGSERDFAILVHDELRRLAFPDEAIAAAASTWTIAELPLQRAGAAPMGLEELVAFALHQGLAQVAKVGSPLNPFLVLDSGKAFFFVCTAGNGDPMGIALQALRDRGNGARCCALVVDTRIAFEDGVKHDAILAMASDRDAAQGHTWAQRYRPKSCLRSFKAIGAPERVGGARNLFLEAQAN